MSTVIITDKMLHGGMTSGKIDGKTVFIEGALPQEEVELVIIQEKKDYSIASLQKILTPSPHRISPPCPLYGLCGGCNLMHADDDCQRQLRTSILLDAFRREGIEVPVKLVSGRSLAYRNRYQFESSGLKSAKSNIIVPISFCPAADDAVNRFLANEQMSGKVKVFGSSRIKSAKGYVFAQEEENTLPRVQIRRGKKIKSGGKRTIYNGTITDQSREAVLTILDKEIIFDVRGFFQSNIEMLEKTAELIKPYIQSGMEKEVRHFLSRSAIPLIISLSCDPVTHARDCAELVKNGYTIKILYALDYYPQTSHIESLAICIKN